MASRPEKEAMALSGVANFLQAYLQAKKETQKQKMDDARFNATLAAKRLEDQQAEQWKRTQFALDQEKAINQIAGMGREQFFTDPRTGQVTNQAPVMNPADIEAAQKRVRALLPGAQYGYTPNAPLLGLDTGPQQPVTNAATVVPSGAFPGLSTGAPAPTETLTVNPAPSTPETLRQFPRPGTGVKSTGNGGAGDGSSASPQQQRDVYKAVADYEKIQTESDYIISTLNNLQKLAPVARGGVGGAMAQKISSATGIGSDSESFKNTATLINGLKGMAVQLLKPTFGGNISDGEREEVMKISGALETMQPEERLAAMHRMTEIATLAAQRAKDVATSLSENNGVTVKWQDRTNRKPISAATGAPENTNPFANMSDADLAKREAELKAKMLGGK